MSGPASGKAWHSDRTAGAATRGAARICLAGGRKLINNMKIFRGIKCFKLHGYKGYEVRVA